MSVRVDAGNDRIDLVLVEDDGALRVARLGIRGEAADLPGGRPAVEIVTVDSGHVPSTPRLVGGAASLGLRYVDHDSRTDATSTLTRIRLADDAGLEATLELEVLASIAAVRAVTTVTNRGERPRILRSVTSLSLRVALGSTAITTPTELALSAAKSDWVGESRWSTTPVRDLLVDLKSAAHDGGDARGSHSVASSGTWSTGRSLPTGVLVADTEGSAGSAIAWEIEHNGGWRWEVGEDAPGTYLALAGPTDVDHQWRAELAPGESFQSVPARVAIGTGVDGAIEALTDLRRALRRAHPDNDARPVVFNDYMNTLMGDPTTERLLPLIEHAAEAGAEVFCIDAGWYDDSGDWWYSVGDWQPSTVRFPNGGLRFVLDRIRDRDMVAGLWLEPEVIGVDSPAASRMPDDAFLQLSGQRIVEHGRYHLDLRHPAVIAHLDEVIDRLVNDLGVGYLKLDYNINPGPGSDLGGRAPGDGLLLHNRAHLAWLESVLDRHPHLVLENCASGAMRMDSAMLSRLQLQSTSDQQDPLAYPPIAASAPLAMIPEQAANWAYPQPDMTDEEIAFTLCTALLGRFYLSGRLDGMSNAQRMLVAEGVAAHKRLRSAIGSGHPSWPLGIDQWAADWVAQCIDDSDESYLTLWKRSNTAGTIEISLPRFAGGDIVVDLVFPLRLEAWQTSWDAPSGVLTIAVSDDEPAARTFRVGTSQQVERVVVDATATTGAIHGGATGMLYGMADPGVPAHALVAGVRPRTLAQKAPGGLQHPGGDALEIADSYFAAGGEEILVYLQDLLVQWPYEEIGVEAYSAMVHDVVSAVTQRDDSDRFVWVPFNEGDWIWYADWSDIGRSRFLADWSAMFRVIRSIDPTARIAGPNESHYYPNRMVDFLSYCSEHGVVPDVISWHELQPSSLEVFPAHVAAYRGLESSLGIAPRPININEYANRRDTSVPGRLLPWIELLETGKVDGDLAYWTMAGNLDDHAVGKSEANSGWWMLHWYAQLRGQSLVSTVPNRGVRNSLSALAALDGDIVTAILGGSSAAVELRVLGLADGARRVRIEHLAWSGYEGALSAAAVIVDEVMTVVDGVLVVATPATSALDAFRITITPEHTGPSALVAARRQVVDVDAAGTTDVDWVRYDDDWQQYAGTGRRGIRALVSSSSRIAARFDVPKAGNWDLGLLYGTDGVGADVQVSIDGSPATSLALPATLTRGFLGRVLHRVGVSAGSHTIEISPSSTVVGGDVAIDSIELVPVAEGAWFDALDAFRREGTAEFPHGGIGAAGVRLVEGEAVRFFVGVPTRGRYHVVLSASDGLAVIESGGARWGNAGDIALAAGITEVTVTAQSPSVLVHGLSVTLSSPAAELTPVDSSNWTAPGSAVTSVVAPAAGRYLMTISYANADRISGHEYNADVINRKLEVRCGAADPVEVIFPFTHNWENFRDLSEVVDIPAGTREVVFDAINGPGPRIASVAFDILVAPEEAA